MSKGSDAPAEAEIEREESIVAYLPGRREIKLGTASRSASECGGDRAERHKLRLSEEPGADKGLTRWRELVCLE